LAVSVTCTWLYSLNLLRKLHILAAFVVTISDVFTFDLPNFVLLYVVILMGFSSAFTLLFQRDTEPGFLSLSETIYTMFAITINGFDSQQYLDANVPLFTLVAFIVFTITATFLLLNLFIAMINSTYSRNIHDRDNQIVFSVGQCFLTFLLSSFFILLPQLCPCCDQNAAMTLFLERRAIGWFFKRTGELASQYNPEDTTDKRVLYVESQIASSTQTVVQTSKVC